MNAYSVMYAWNCKGKIEVSPVCVAFSDPNKAAEKAASLIKAAVPNEAKIAVFDGEKFITEGYCVVRKETIRYDVILDETGERLETYHPHTYGYSPEAKQKAKEEAEMTVRKSIRYGIKCHVEEIEYAIRIDEE